jgi:NADH-quinone oxidoreductase subunit G
LTEVERITTPLIREEGGLIPATWEKALQAVVKGLRGAPRAAGVLSGRNTNEEAFLFAKLMKKVSPDALLEVFYQERELDDVQKILVSPDRSPNFRGGRDMGVSGDGSYESLLRKLVAGDFSAAYIVGEDLVSSDGAGEKIGDSLKKLSFLVVQDIQLTAAAKFAHVVLPATHFGEKEGTYTNRKGRVQKLNPAIVPPEGVLPDSEIFINLLEAAGEKLHYSNPSQVFEALAAEIPLYRGLTYAAIGAEGIQLGAETKQRS